MEMPQRTTRQIVRKHVRAHFERAATSYRSAAILQQEVETRLQERLQWLKREPTLAMDLGCGPGAGLMWLKQRFPKAHVLGVDLAASMLKQARAQQNWLQRWHAPLWLLQAEAEHLPIRAQTLDLLYSSLCVQWCEDLPAVLAEWRRVLKPGAMLLFSSFGPDTLHELRQAWSAVDSAPHVNPFLDMHLVGDAMLQAGFRDPVLETDRIVLTYSQVTALLRDLKAIGASNALADRAGGLGGKSRIAAMQTAYPRRSDGHYAATYEVVYAMAFAPEDGAPIRRGNAEVASVDVRNVPIRRKI